ncbi:84_t:CDS:10 [Ambispora gerdemannii]|uniref:84_t:CDS:1 n=1 Tax=Ambispora gerdemannii TaxID=144530 RepID=A0A9N8VPT1_9GLOM|nr:84_t:CDS:10 [Ambispora gerdemannii]
MENTTTTIVTEDIIFRSPDIDVGDLHHDTEEIRKDTKNILSSIDEDAKFVNKVASMIPYLPIIANERCGTWYIDSKRISLKTVYFKSTDGHTGKWSFNIRRFNSHLLDIISEHGGCIIVDSTRRGKRIPDSLSKTIPIWCCTINQAIATLRRKKQYIDSDHTKDNDKEWDIEFHSPPSTVSKSEHDQIASRIPEFVEKLLDPKLNVTKYLEKLSKPLRPLWITSDSNIFDSELLPDYTSLPFYPVICLSASQMVTMGMESRQGYQYIQGAADDQETWSLGLTPSLFWKHRKEILDNSYLDPIRCERKVREIVEYAKVESLKSPLINGDSFNFLGNTNIAIGNRKSGCPPLCWQYFDYIVNCTPHGYNTSSTNSSTITQSTDISSSDKANYIQLPIPEGKKGQHVLFEMIPKALDYLRIPLLEHRRILIHCEQGIDRSVGIALAILVNYFDDNEKCIEDGIDREDFKVVTKDLIQRRLFFIISYRNKANPSRATMKKVNAFFMNDKDI